MCKSLYRVILTACVIATAGCANQSQNIRGTSSDEMDAIRHVGVQPAVGADVDLGEKTKAKVAAATAVKVLAGVFGGGFQVRPGQRNVAPAEGYTQLDGHATVFTPQEAETFNGPATAMAEAMNRQMKTSGFAVTPQSPYSLNVRGKVWGLDYDKLSEKDDYRLYYDVEVDLIKAGKPVLAYDCQGVTEDKRGLDEWEANDKVAVKKDAAVIGDICAGKALASMSLIPAANAAASTSATASSPDTSKSSG
jgi:hypothetical protein